VPAKKITLLPFEVARQQRDASFVYIISIIRFAVTQEAPELRIFGTNQDLFFNQGYV
jgi:hypothetical protein